MTNPLALAVQHKLLAMTVVGCLGAGGAAVAITLAPPTPAPLLAPASAASAVPRQPASGSAGGVGASGAATTVTSPAAATSPGRPAGAAAATVAPVTAAARAASTTKPAVTPAKGGSGSSPSSGAPGSAAAPGVPTSAVSCPSNQRLTDAEIKWLLGEVAKTASSNPSVAPGAATIQAQLSPLLGQNQCAAQAQPVVTALCSGSATRKTINAMASQMPFLVKLVVGNPCSDNLASLLPTLSSYTSLL